jgi:hypothetical protein
VEWGAPVVLRKRRVAPSANAMALRFAHFHNGPIGVDAKKDQASKLVSVKLHFLLDHWVQLA